MRETSRFQSRNLGIRLDLFSLISAYEGGVGHVYSQSKGRGQRKMLWGSAPDPNSFCPSNKNSWRRHCLARICPFSICGANRRAGRALPPHILQRKVFKIKNCCLFRNMTSPPSPPILNFLASTLFSQGHFDPQKNIPIPNEFSENKILLLPL